MKKTVKTLCLMLPVLGFASQSPAAPVTLVDQGDSWEYKILDHQAPLGPLEAQYHALDYNTFDWSQTLPFYGAAAFGNTGDSPAGHWLGGDWLESETEWLEDNDIALRKTITLAADATDITINVAADNGFILFIDGTEVAKENGPGFTTYWEYSYSNLNPALFQAGTIDIEVLAFDDLATYSNDATFFDMQISANMVPVPPTLLLFLTGMIGLVGIRIRYSK